MALIIKNNRDFQRVQKLPFCYLCGKTFRSEEKKTRDHVPPKALFLKEDRKFPLILPTHLKCNQNESWADEIVGQLMHGLHGIYPPKEKIKIKIGLYKNTANNQPMLAIEGINFKGFIGRCVKAFHATLYNECLTDDIRNWFDTPMRAGIKEHDRVIFEKSSNIPLFVEVIKKNRMAGKLDRVECFNSKCIYECVWEQMDNGEWMCIFALNIYDWKNLGDPSLQHLNGCVGFYMPKEGLPKNSTKGITRILEMPICNLEPLDPFGF